MARVAQDNLKELIDKVEGSYQAFSDNYSSFSQFMQFIFVSSLTDKDKALLKGLRKPTIEVNILEAFVSRLRGEFAKQEPSFEAEPADPNKPTDPQLLTFLEGYMRHLLNEANDRGFEYRTYTDQLGGGWGVMEVKTEYAGRRRFDLKPCIDNPYDATMVYFDDKARQPHKGDGEYCGKMYPMDLAEFKSQFKGVNIDDIEFKAKGSASIGGFNWATKDGNKKCVLVCEHYEKEYKDVKIVHTAMGDVMTKDKYDEYVKQFDNSMQVAPIIVEERTERDCTIVRYTFVQSRVLKKEKTDFMHLPLIFADGNSVRLRSSIGGVLQQVTRPYAYHAKGLQRLKNFSVQTLANELENTVQTKWVAAKEGIPVERDYQDAYANPQTYQTLIYNQYMEEEPDKQVNPPIPVQRTGAPPEIMGTVQMTDQMAQTVLGTFDSSQGQMNMGQLSGIAVMESVTQSNAVSMPYLVGFMQALTQLAQVIVDLIPKIHIKPNQLPVVNQQGQKGTVPVNQMGGLNLQYEPGTINIKVKASANFTIQKNRALSQMMQMMQASPLMAEFIGSTEGLPLLLDNMEMKGLEQFKDAANKFIQQKQQQAQQQQQMQMQQMQAQAQQMQQQISPQQVQMQRLQVEQEKLAQNAQQMQLDAKRAEIEGHQKQASLENDRHRLALDAAELHEKSSLARTKHESERMGKAIENALKHTEQLHRHSTQQQQEKQNGKTT